MRDEIIAQDWDLVKRLLPPDWEESARQCGALRRCRNVQSAETLLRLILLHVAGGLSLRQAVVRAERLGWAKLSDVALLKRLRASGTWLEYLCCHLWEGLDWPEGVAVQRRGWRIVDATAIQEPGSVGSNWRVHYSVRLPTLHCDFVSVTNARGGETFCRFPVRAGEVVLADRGYSHRAGVGWVLSHGAHVIVRHQGPNFPVTTPQGHPFELLPALRGLREHDPGTWTVRFACESGDWEVWLHAVRKSAAAAERAKTELRREHGAGVQPETLELAEYVVVLSSLSPKDLSGIQALGLYRGRWQIELVFKRLKGLLGIGDLAKYDPGSAQAWMQAKLLTALLIERLEREARLFSPWGFALLAAVEVAGVPGSAGQPPPGDSPGAAAAAVAGGRRGDWTEPPGTGSMADGPDASVN